MRVKELWSVVPVPKTVVKHLYTSLTLSRYTILFTISLLIYTLTLSSLHVSSYVPTHIADLTLSNLMEVASVRTDLIPVITTDQQGQDVLQLCDGIPNGASDDRCSTVFVPSPTAIQSEVPNNVQPSPSTSSSGTLRTTQSPSTPEAANVPTTTVGTSTTATPAQDNLLADTPTSISSTSTSTANATTSLVLGIAEVEPTTSSSSITTTAIADLKSADASTTETSSTAVESSSDTTSTDIPAPTEDPISSASSSETNSVDTTTSTVDSTTSAPPLITSAPPLVISSEDSSTSDVSTTSTTSSEDQTTTTSTSSTDAISTTSTSADSASAAQTSTSTDISSTSTPESSATSTSSADVNIASEDASTTTSASVSKTDGILSIETAPLSTTSTLSSTSATSSTSSEATSSVIPDVGLGPEEAQDDSPSLQPLPNVNISSADSPSHRRAVLRRSLSATPVTNSSGSITGVNVTGLQSDGSATFLDLGCAGALTLVEVQLHESWTEDLLMVGYHIWLLLLGGFAIASESIPHTLASLFSTVLALIWSASQLSESRTFRNQFTQFITNGACDGVDLLPTYWAERMKVDIAIFVLDGLAVVAFGFMGAKLVKDYRKRMSAVVGQGEERRVYKTVLLLSVVIQLGAFLQLASLSLWAQQLFTSPIALASSSTSIFKPLSLISILVTIPWLVLGLFAIRKESTLLMLIFIIIDIAFIGEWVVFFSSDVYRLVFTKWTFFAAGTVGTFGVLVGCLMSGVLAWMQFGRGLSEKLAQATLDPVDTTPWEFSSDTEKAWEPFGTEKSVARGHTLGGSIGGGNPTHKPSSSFERSLDPFSSNPGFGTGGLGIGYGVGITGNYGSLGFGKPFRGGDERPGSNLTSLTGSTGRGSTAFSYGLRSPAPPMPEKREEYLS